MSDRTFFRKNPLITVILIIFAAWMVYLIVLTVIPATPASIYDVLNAPGTPTTYSSTIPFLRYFIEPLIGISFFMAYGPDVVNLLIALIVPYIVLRVSLLIIDQKMLKQSEKKKIVMAYIKNTLDLFAIFGTIIFLIMLAILLGGMGLVGQLFLVRTFQTILHVGIFIGVIFLIGVSIFNIYRYFHPRLTLKKKKQKEGKSSTKKYLSMAGREGLYLWTAFLIVAYLMFTLISASYPLQYIETNKASDEFLFDFHVHSWMSDGFLSPPQRVLWYMSQGIDGAAFTDHETIQGAQIAQAFIEQWNLDFTVFTAQEFTAGPIHLNLYGLPASFVPAEEYGPNAPNAMNVSDMINYTKANGGYVIVNHYYAFNDSNMPYTHEQLRDWGVDGFEIANGGQYDKRYSDIRAFCIANNLTMLSNSDIHPNHELNTFVKLRLDDPTNLTLDHVFECLSNNTHECLIIPKYAYSNNYPSDLLFTQFLGFHLYLMNLDYGQALSWMAWSAGGFLTMIFIIWRIKKADLTKVKDKVTLVEFKKITIKEKTDK